MTCPSRREDNVIKFGTNVAGKCVLKSGLGREGLIKFMAQLPTCLGLVPK